MVSRLFRALVAALAPALAFAQGSTQGVVAYIHSPTWYQFGSNVQPVGDVDGDGFGDLVITGRLTQGGSIVGGTYSGRDGSTINSWAGSGLQNLTFGPLRAVGDIDQDGHIDVIYGSSGTKGQGLLGKAVVFSGKTGQQKLLLSDTFTDTEFGATVDGAGDVDLDGVPDLVIGAPTFNPWGIARGPRDRLLRGHRGHPLELRPPRLRHHQLRQVRRARRGRRRFRQ